MSTSRSQTYAYWYLDRNLVFILGRASVEPIASEILEILHDIGGQGCWTAQCRQQFVVCGVEIVDLRDLGLLKKVEVCNPRDEVQ